MNIVNIILKEIKQNLRDTKGMVMMVLFPIVLIIILGSALNGSFTSSKDSFEVKVLYTNEGKSDISQSFEKFTDSVKKLKIDFIKTSDINKAKENVKNGEYECYINVNSRENKIELYKNDRYNFKSSILESVLNSFIGKYNTVLEIAKVNPRVIPEIVNSKNINKQYVKTKTLNKKRSPSAKDYYTITMLTLIIMYASLNGADSILGEKIIKTWNRIIISPTKKYNLFIGKILGTFFVTVIQASIVILVSKYVMGSYWGENIVVVILIVIAQIIMSISIGIGIAFLIKNDNIVGAVLQAIIPIIIFLAGGYIPIESMGSKMLLNVAKLSPVKWVNDAIFKVIYANDFSYVMPAIVINLSVAAAFLILSTVTMRKEA